MQTVFWSLHSKRDNKMGVRRSYTKMAQMLCLLLWLLGAINCTDALAKFTNIQCDNLDQSFAAFTVCRMRAIKRDVTELTIKVKLLQPHTMHMTMRWQLLKKASGYKPFLYDVSADVCEYLEKRNHPFVNIILNTFGNHSTGITRCPLDEITLEKFRFPVKALKLLPLPTGEYAIFATFGAGGQNKAIVKTYFQLVES